MELNQLAKEVHINAVEHGWWENERSFAEIIALIHSELSEALEEYRNGKPNLYYECKYHDTRTKCPDQFNGCQYGKNEGCNIRKPEGIAVELADVIIRILDYCGKEDINIDEMMNQLLILDVNFQLPELISECHLFISLSYNATKRQYIEFTQNYFLIKCIALIMNWCTKNGIDVENIILLKHEYNRTREYKHGGKVI